MTKILVYLNFVLTLILATGFIYLMFFKVYPESIKYVTVPGDTVAVTSPAAVSDDTCGEGCKTEIGNIVNSKLATLATPAGEKIIEKTVTITPAPAARTTQTMYIPLSGPITTTSSNWYDAPGTDFTLDFNGLGAGAKGSWEAFLKVAHNNGVAYARLYDVTHGIAVNGSEISLSNNSQLTDVSSGVLSFWAGNNHYRVQLKSLNTFEVTFGSGRVKITY